MSEVKKWLERHGKALQSAGVIVAILAAVATLVGVKFQIDASARQQREQSARDIYREFLNLSISKPEFANPDYCAIRGSPNEGAYETYVEYLLYTSEQILQALPDWQHSMEQRLSPHRELLCTQNDWSGDAPEVQQLIDNFRSKQCRTFKPSCD